MFSVSLVASNSFSCCTLVYVQAEHFELKSASCEVAILFLNTVFVIFLCNISFV